MISSESVTKHILECTKIDFLVMLIQDLIRNNCTCSKEKPWMSVGTEVIVQSLHLLLKLTQHSQSARASLHSLLKVCVSLWWQWSTYGNIYHLLCSLGGGKNEHLLSQQNCVLISLWPKALCTHLCTRSIKIEWDWLWLMWQNININNIFICDYEYNCTLVTMSFLLATDLFLI